MKPSRDMMRSRRWRNDHVSCICISDIGVGLFMGIELRWGCHGISSRKGSCLSHSGRSGGRSEQVKASSYLFCSTIM